MRTFLLTIVALGCSEELPSELIIEGYRPLVVVADPPEVDPDGQSTLRVHDFDTETRPVRYRWEICLLSLGASTNFECEDEDLVQTLQGEGAEVTVDFGSAGLNIRAFYEAYGPIPSSSGELLTLEDGFDVFVHVVAEPAGDRAHSIYKRVHIREGDSLNRNPVVEGISMDDAAARPLMAGETVELRVEIDPESEETDPEGEPEALEYQWRSVEGASLELASDPQSVEFVAAEAGTYAVFVVVRDGRGGATTEQLSIDVK